MKNLIACYRNSSGMTSKPSRAIQQAGRPEFLRRVIFALHREPAVVRRTFMYPEGVQSHSPGSRSAPGIKSLSRLRTPKGYNPPQLRKYALEWDERYIWD
jgi:hypothetical protein